MSYVLILRWIYKFSPLECVHVVGLHEVKFVDFKSMWKYNNNKIFGESAEGL